MQPMSTKQLQQLAAKAPQPPTAGNYAGASARHNGHDAWAKAALEGELGKVFRTRAEDHNRNNQLNESAFALGQIVGGGGLDRSEVERELERAARAIGLESGEITSTIRSGVEAGMRDPRRTPENTMRNNGHTPHPQQAEAVNNSAALKSEAAAESILKFQTAKEIAEATPKEAEWIAKPWIAKGTITKIDGKIKAAGKTTFVTHLCRQVVDGLPFMGEATTKTPIVYLTEQPARSFREALRRADLLERDDFIVLFWHNTIGVKWPDVMRATVKKAQQIGASMIVVDTLAQFAGLRGDAENSTGDGLEAMEPLQEAAGAHGLAVGLVCHERKSGGEVGEAGRGSSAFGGAVDIILSLRRPEGSAPPNTRVIHALSRFDETPDTLALELTEDGYQSIGSDDALSARLARTALLDIIPSTEEAAQKADDLQASLHGVKRTTLQNVIAQLIAEGDIRQTGGGKRGSPYRYWRPAPGEGG